MSQGSPDPNWTSFPISKFSHNTSPVGTRNFVWNHISGRSDMFYILRSMRVVDDHGNYANRLIMKVTGGAETLEVQDLGELVQLSREFHASSGPEHPIQVVIRSPFLALRYPKNAQEVRRIQVKFNSHDHYTQACTALRELGFPISESVSGSQTPKPSLTPVQSSSPVPAVFSPISATSSRTVDTPVPPSDLVRESSCPTYSSSLSTKFKMPVRPESSPAIGRMAQPARSQITNAIGRSSSVTGTPSFPVAMTHLPSFYVAQLERQSQDRRLSSSGLRAIEQTCQTQTNAPVSHYLSQMRSQGQMLQDRDMPNKKDRSLTESPYFTSGSSTTRSTMEGAFEDPEACDIFTSAHQIPPMVSFGENPAQPVAHHAQISRSASLGIYAAQLPEASQLCISQIDTPRSTSPEKEVPVRHAADVQPSQSDSGLLTSFNNMYDLPPRRELPFPRPQSAEMVRSASASDLPPLPKPTPMARAGSSIVSTEPAKVVSKVIATPVPKPATKKRIAQRKAPVVKPVVQEPPPREISSPSNSPPAVNVKVFSKVITGNSTEEEPSPLAAKSAAASSSRPSSTSGLPSKATIVKKRAPPARPASAAKRSKMVDQSTQTQTNSLDTPTAVSRTNVSANVPPPVTPNAGPTPSVPPTYLNMIDTFLTNHQGRPAPKEVFQTPEYEQASVEERHYMVNDFICENLENSDFLALCEDVGMSWRRLGLGM